MLSGFSLGLGTLIGAMLGAFVEVAEFTLQRLIARLEGRIGPRRPSLVMGVLLTVIGATAGSLWLTLGFYIQCLYQARSCN